jgi:hypothetical protein
VSKRRAAVTPTQACLSAKKSRLGGALPGLPGAFNSGADRRGKAYAADVGVRHNQERSRRAGLKHRPRLWDPGRRISIL